MIVVLDTNIWVSALHFGARGGTVVRAFERAVTENTIATCDQMEAEIVRVFVEKFSVAVSEIEAIMRPILEGSIRVRPVGLVQVCRDPKDDMFLECAALAKADWIVAGDKDLLVLKSYANARIVTPAEFLAAIE